MCISNGVIQFPNELYFIILKDVCTTLLVILCILNLGLNLAYYMVFIEIYGPYTELPETIGMHHTLWTEIAEKQFSSVLSLSPYQNIEVVLKYTGNLGRCFIMYAWCTNFLSYFVDISLPCYIRNYFSNKKRRISIHSLRTNYPN